MTCDSSVSSLRLDSLSIGANKNRCHQTERSITLSDNIRLDVTIVVLAGPDESSGALDSLSNHIVD
jgi:hypothetical protein